MSGQKAIKIKEDLNKLLNHKVYPKEIVYQINRGIALANVAHMLDEKKLIALLLLVADNDHNKDNEELK